MHFRFEWTIGQLCRSNGIIVVIGIISRIASLVAVRALDATPGWILLPAVRNHPLKEGDEGNNASFNEFVHFIVLWVQIIDVGQGFSFTSIIRYPEFGGNPAEE